MVGREGGSQWEMLQKRPPEEQSLQPSKLGAQLAHADVKVPGLVACFSGPSWPVGLNPTHCWPFSSFPFCDPWILYWLPFILFPLSLFCSSESSPHLFPSAPFSLSSFRRAPLSTLPDRRSLGKARTLVPTPPDAGRGRPGRWSSRRTSGLQGLAQPVICVPFSFWATSAADSAFLSLFFKHIFRWQ